MSRIRLPALILPTAWAMAGMASACQIPVFRYALERWEADAYVAKVFPSASGEFSPDEQAAIDFLRKIQSGVGDGSGIPANLDLKIGEESSGAEAAGERSAAWMQVFYPPRFREGGDEKAIWAGPLTLDNARRLVDSPARREIVERILNGQSAVWVLLASGNAGPDAAAEELVAEALAVAGEKLAIPEGVMTAEEAETVANPAGLRPDDVVDSQVPLKIDFSLLRISRQDPAEVLFLPMLLHIEADLGEFAGEPMVFPVFGRGRLLEPLIGEGVSRDNVLDYAGYICGACSCEVKYRNPGQDLLIAADWRSALEGSEVAIDKILPPLEGTGILSQAAAAADAAAPMETGPETGGATPAGSETLAEAEAETSPAGETAGPEAGPDLAPTILVGSVLILVLAAGTLLILLKKPS